MTETYRPGQVYKGADGDLLFVILPGDDIEFVTNRGTRLPLTEIQRVYAPLKLVYAADSRDEVLSQAPRLLTAPVYPAPGSAIPDMPGYVVGECGHRVAASEWRAGCRTCERCPAQQAGGAL
jgi:hypothetical protein